VIKELRPSDPQTVGLYRLLGRLGVGGMGQVYLAKSQAGRLVAIKVIRPDLADERGFRARFAREIAAARNVSGVYTAAVIDSDTDAELPWMATAYVPGPSLADAVEDDGPLPVKTVLALAAGLAEALAAIHRAGVVHRDLKPSNVLLAADGPRVIDFGISLAAERSMLTTTGVVIGSPGFMSPEQARGLRQVGEPTDVFSLGAVLAFAATGDGPFGGGPTPALLYRVVNEEPELGRVPVAARPLIQRCLAKDPADRPTTADILRMLGDEADLMEEWLPESVADAIGRYIPTIETPAPPPPAASETTDPVAGAQPGDAPTDATQDIMARSVVTDTVGIVAAGERNPPSSAISEIPPLMDPAASAPGDNRLSHRPAAAVGRAGRLRWPISVAAAVIIVAVVATVLAVEPGSAHKLASGPPSSLVRITTRPTAQRTPTAGSSTTSAATDTRKPDRKRSSAALRIHPSQTPTPGGTASPTPDNTSPSTQTLTHGPSKSPSPTQQKTSPAPSGVQVISAYTGASSEGCASYSSSGSASGGSAVAYSFANESGADIQVWVISGGIGTLEGTVSPGDSLSPSVETGEDWMVANSGGGCMGIFAINGGGSITVGS
jgi:eukaryotic-like serine/threonine-protein kinase